jgi:TonB family protein
MAGKQVQQNEDPTKKVYRVGGGVTPPKLVDSPDPAYGGVDGTAVVQVIVGADGKVKEAKVTKSLSPKSDANALKAIKRWKFRPALKDGQPVAVQIMIEIRFRH